MDIEIVTNRKIRRKIITTILWCFLVYYTLGLFIMPLLAWIGLIILYFKLTSKYSEVDNIGYSEMCGVIGKTILGFFIITIVSSVVLNLFMYSQGYYIYHYHQFLDYFFPFVLFLAIIEIICFIVFCRVLINKYPDERNDQESIEKIEINNNKI